MRFWKVSKGGCVLLVPLLCSQIGIQIENVKVWFSVMLSHEEQLSTQRM